MWKVSLRKVRSTWYYFTTNPQGGGFGSAIVGSKSQALTRATQNIPDGATFEIYTNNKFTSRETKSMKRFNPLKPQTPSSAPLTKPRCAPRAPGAAEFTTTLTENPAKNGIELRFDTRPSDDVLTSLKAHGWYWSRRRMCWYHKNTPENREFAQRFLNPPAPIAPATSTATTPPSPISPSPSPETACTNPAPITNVIPVQFAPAAPTPAAVPMTPASTPIWRARLIRHGN